MAEAISVGYLLAELRASGGIGREDLKLVDRPTAQLRQALAADDRQRRFEIIGACRGRHLHDTYRSAGIFQSRHRGILDFDLSPQRAQNRIQLINLSSEVT